MIVEANADDARRLIKFGFIKDPYFRNYAGKTNKEIMVLDDSTAMAHADMHKCEVARANFGVVADPTPAQDWRLIYEQWGKSVDSVYFWILNMISVDMGYAKIYKLADLFAASENSAFFGVTQQRIGLQQDKVSQFLATIGKMVKELFQLVRELRILDERLGLYKDSTGDNEDKKVQESAEISLKGFWIDLVEGGSKNPSSVYGMSSQVGFAILPDLFFGAPAALAGKKVDEYVDSLEFNNKVKEVLKRKLRTYIEWKLNTHKELQNRRTFTIKYLRQHFDIIKMYMSWVKPYLKNIRRLELMDKSESPELIKSFESSLIELEFLAVKKKSGSTHNSVMLVRFHYRTKPEMSYQQEGYQRGPLHIGRIEMFIKVYGWSDQQVESYRKYRQQEDLELLTSLDESVRAAYEALGEDLEKYLKEAGEAEPGFKKPEAEKPKLNVAEPFTSVFKGLWELGGAFMPKKGDKKKKGPKRDFYKESLNKKEAISEAKKNAWNSYKNFKKAHEMLSW